MSYSFRVLKNKEDKESLIDFIGAMRIVFFRSHPYKYWGSFAYEQEYLKCYPQTADARIVEIKHGTDLIGFATGIPFKILSNYFDDYMAHIRERALNLDL